MSRTTDLNDYRYYAEVVAHGGFAAASRVLNLPKSKLSRRISGLEERLGVCLIERSTRHFRVTELGRSFYQHCQTIIEVSDEAETIIAEARSGEPSGDVRFSCPTGLLEIVSPTLPGFLARHPRVRLQMLAIDRPVDLIQEGVDIAIRVRTRLDSSSTLKMRSLGISRKILVTSPDLAAASGSDIVGLANLPTLSTSEEPGEAEWLLVGPGGVPMRLRHIPRVRCGDFAAIRDAAADGSGIALLPDHTCRNYLAAEKLVQVFPQWHSPDSFVHLVFSARKGLPASVRALIDHLVGAFPPGMLSGPSLKPKHLQSDGELMNARVPVAAS